jgi:hypothetical protein
MTHSRRGLLFPLLLFVPLTLPICIAHSQSMLVSDGAAPYVVADRNAVAQGDTTPDDPADDQINQVRAKKLIGSVHMATQKETALSTVLIEECDASWSRVLGTTKTDYQGNFKLKPAGKGKVHYLRLSAKGFKTRHYEVSLSPDAPDELKLELQLASRWQGGSPRNTGRVFLS